MRVTELSFDDQVAHILALIGRLKPPHIHERSYADIIRMTRDIPEKFFPVTFPLLVATTFNLDVTLVKEALTGVTKVKIEDFETLVPKTGWLHDYITYTKNTEPPTVFHFFAALSVLGATIARRIYFPRGSGDVFPNICAVLVAPPGKCKKTTACNIAVHLYRKIGGNVLADKITPEAIVDSFQKQTTATGLIYAPEWAVFLGKQQYMEGLVPMLTALFDCPSVWSSTTIMRGNVQLLNVALSHLAATTIDWMQTSITKDAFAGGFMSRLLFVVQKDTPRSFPLPPPLDLVMQQKLIDGLLNLQQVVGEATMSPEAMQWYIAWYSGRTMSGIEKAFAGYYERKPDRLLQLAMVLNAARDPKNLELSMSTLKHAEKILTWIEYYLPGAFEELAATSVGDDQLRMLKQLRKAKGEELKHSDWLRMNTSRMNSDVFKKYVETLMQSGMVTYDKTKHMYYLLQAGRATE